MKYFSSKKMMLISLLCCMTLALTGCLYPKTDSAPTNIVSKQSMRNVQGAIDQYLEEKGILPIYNSDSSVDRYEKFRINFDTLKKEGYIDLLPSSSFEGGGIFYFLILNEETEPTVKAQNIYIMQKVNDVQRAATDYFYKTGEYPIGQQRYEQFYSIDWDVLKIKQPELHSMYSGSIMELMISEAGIIYLNYASDIYQMMQSQETALAESSDLREILVMHSDYVPVKSAPYRLENGEPVPYLQ